MSQRTCRNQTCCTVLQYKDCYTLHLPWNHVNETFKRIFIYKFYSRNNNSCLGPDFKVILLQRDPRASINSILKEPQEWLSGAAAPTKICGNLLNDYNAVKQVRL